MSRSVLEHHRSVWERPRSAQELPRTVPGASGSVSGAPGTSPERPGASQSQKSLFYRVMPIPVAEGVVRRDCQDSRGSACSPSEATKHCNLLYVDVSTDLMNFGGP